MTSTIRLRSRPGLAGAVALALLAPAAAGADQHVRTAEPPPPRSSEVACPPGFESPDNGFTDIGSTSVHVRNIRCAAELGLTSGGPGGQPADQFGPGLTVRRDQMASFVARLLTVADDETDEVLLPPWDGTNRFSDVSSSSPHLAAINRLAAAGIVRGGVGGAPATTFSPHLGVTRAQVATFLLRADDRALRGSFTSGETYFDDLAGVLDEHAANIAALAEEGVVTGRQVGTEWRFDPHATVRRDQMATMLARDVALFIGYDVVGHTFVEPGPGSGAEPVVSPGFPSGGGATALLTDVRLARHPGFDRFVLELELDGGPPAHAIRYVEPPVHEDGSGRPIELSGDAYLSVELTPASAFDFDTGQSTYTGPRRFELAGGPGVTEATDTGDFEGHLGWVVGVDRIRPFSVSFLTAPYRIVVDVAVE